MTHHNAPERLFMIISMIRNSIYDDLDECYSDLTSHNFDEINFIITGTKTYIFWKPYGHLGSILRGLSVIKWCHDRDSYQKLWPDTNNELKPLWYFDRKLWFFIISGLILIKIITKNKHMRFTVLTHLSGYACESCWLITNQIISDLEANTLKLPTVWLWDLKKCALKSCSFQNKSHFGIFQSKLNWYSSSYRTAYKGRVIFRNYAFIDSKNGSFYVNRYCYMKKR